METTAYSKCLSSTNIKIIFRQSNWIFFSWVAEMKDKLWHGYAKAYQKWFLTFNMTLLAKFHQGHLQAPVWQMKEENGFLISDNMEMDGPHVLYIYPGLKLGLQGHFDNGKMIGARPVEILSFQCTASGMMKPIWKFIEGNSDEFSYDPAKEGQVSSNPLLKDPLEDFWVEVQTRCVFRT